MPSLPLELNNHSDSARHCHSEDAGNKGGLLRALFANADRVGFARHARRADIDVVAASSQVDASVAAKSDVVR